MKPIKLATGDGFAEIVLNRPEILNAINLEMLTHLSEAFDSCWKDERVKVIVLKGSGGNFSSGADLKQFLDFASGKGSPMEYGVNYPALTDGASRFTERTCPSITLL